MRSSGLEMAQTLLIIGGSVPLWLLVGFLVAWRIGRKCGKSRVYRPDIWDIRVIVSVVIGVASILFGQFVVGFLYPLITVSLLAGVEFLVVGGAFASPLGTILFERTARSRLWILGTPSLMWPSSIEYHIEWAGRSHIALTT